MVRMDAVYLTDNGAVYCGRHLGHTAQTTGRDISGQPIMEVTPEIAKAATADGFPIQCEKCGRMAVAVIA